METRSRSRDAEQRKSKQQNDDRKGKEVVDVKNKVEAKSEEVAVRNITEKDKSGVSSQAENSSIQTKKSKEESQQSSKSHSKSLSKHSKRTSSTMKRKRLEAQIKADEEMAKVLAKEEELHRQRLAAEQQRLAAEQQRLALATEHEKLEYEKRIIRNRLVLEEISQKDEYEDSTTEEEIHLSSINEEEKVHDWLKSFEEVEPRGKEDKNATENSDIKMLLARQIIDKDLPAFSGDVKEWPNFWNQYTTTTNLLRLNDEENVCRLRKCLR